VGPLVDEQLEELNCESKEDCADQYHDNGRGRFEMSREEEDGDCCEIAPADVKPHTPVSRLKAGEKLQVISI